MRASGFTLTELLIAVAIIAIISAVAMPLYTAYSQRTYRAEASADLLGCAQALERFASVNFTYQGAADSDADGVGDANNGPLATDICNPLSARQQRYAFTVAAPDAATFTIMAMPANAMNATGRLTLDDAGSRWWDENDNTVADAGEDSWDH